VIADVRLIVAGLFWGQKRFFRSINETIRAVLTRPAVIGRPLKRFVIAAQAMVWRVRRNRRSDDQAQKVL
jgi:hypothetical protein